MKQRLAALPLRWKFLLLPATAAVLMLLLWTVYLHERRDADQRLDLISARYLPLMRELAQIQDTVAEEHVRVVGLLAGRLRGEQSPPTLYREGRRSVEALHEAEAALRALAGLLPQAEASGDPLSPVVQALAAYRNEVAETVLQGSVQADLLALYLQELSAAYAVVNHTQAELAQRLQRRLGAEAETLVLRRQTTYRHAMVMMAAALVLLLALSLWLSHLFADDLRALLAALARLRDGQTDAGTEQLAARRDEFGALHGLVQAFRAALVQRDQAERALADEAQDLERRVRERTEALERARLEAERANHAKSEFLSRMSHELRTPLNAILGFGQLMQMQAGDDVQRHRLREILHAGRHLLTLIDEVLDLARVESGHLIVSPEPVALRALAADCIALVRPAATSRGVTLLEPSPLCAVHVRADRTRLKQVLLNLLSNAVKFNSPDGTVAVTCHPELGADPPLVRIRVDDNGPGLDAAALERLFVPFERLDAEARQIQGTGIGLALSKRLVELMGGRIGVDSTPGQGSSFWVLLPLAEPPQPPALPPPPAGDAAPLPGKRQRRRRLLCIEDNPANLRLIEQIFAHRPDVRLITATSPAVGLELARSHGPDLVLLDINLPEMNGYEVLRCLRDHPATRHIPVLAVSASAMPRDLERAKAAGFADYVTKPIDVRRLLERVDALLPAD